jgi:acetolactate synthase I/II/III large subunit
MQSLEKPTSTAHAWERLPAGASVGDAIIAAMVAGGVDHLFFTSGSEIVFYQEAIAKARAHGLPAPRLITMTHEHASLNAALGYAAVSGKPVATAAHVDAGTFNYGGALHTAWHSNLPVMITAGGAPVAYPRSMRGARDRGGHLWLQQTWDQNGIVRGYVKWDHRLEIADNPGTTVSRALQVATSEPRGPVYLTVPRELSLMDAREDAFPTAAQLGIPRPVAPDPDGIRELAERLVDARNPYVVVSSSGRNPATVPALVDLCELLAMPVAGSTRRAYHCFPKDHPLYHGLTNLKEADVVLVLDANVPWIPGVTGPEPDAYVAVVDIDPLKMKTPTYEFTADQRITADALRAIEALTLAVRERMTAGTRALVAERAARWAEYARVQSAEAERDALSRAHAAPIDPIWLAYNIGQLVDDDCIVLDETLGGGNLDRYLCCARPGSYIANPASSGGWSPGAALGAKLAAPERDVIAVTGDGFYMYSTANSAIWAGAHYGAPFMTIVYQNRSYTTATVGVEEVFPGGYAARAGYDGGYFDPPVDFAKEAEAAGAYGENVHDPAEVGPALRRGREAIRRGQPAVISVWLPRILQVD